MPSSTNKIWITKNSGDVVEFSREKLQQSLRHAGAQEKDIQYIISEIEKLLYPEISTKEIYKKAFSLLRKTSRPTAAKYKLKKAIMELGPSGFPFERYIAEVLKSEGYQTQTGRIVQGRCVKHEIDVIAEKNDQRIMVECKFHGSSRRISDVKDPLYIHSRFRDLKKDENNSPQKDIRFDQCWIATNTRFSTDALQYGNCVGLHLLGWNYPPNNSLKKRIDSSKLHPITCLTTLTRKEKDLLLKRNIVLCKDIYPDENVLLSIGIKGIRLKRIMNEAKGLYLI